MLLRKWALLLFSEKPSSSVGATGLLFFAAEWARGSLEACSFSHRFLDQITEVLAYSIIDHTLQSSMIRHLFVMHNLNKNL